MSRALAGRAAADTETPEATVARWSRCSEIQLVGGQRVDTGLLYIGSRLAIQSGGRNDNCLIDPNLPVAKDLPNFEGSGLTFWPDYAAMLPRDRLAFLRWHSQGRHGNGVHPAYALLFFFGLERRLILERAFDDAMPILSAVEHLAREFSECDSVKKVVANFSDAAELLLKGDVTFNAHPRRWAGGPVPLGVLIAIGRLVAERKPIPADLLLGWVISDLSRTFPLPPPAQMSNFAEHFREHLARIRPEGAMFDHPYNVPRLSYTYRSASNTFAVCLDDCLPDVPNIALMRKMRMEAHALVREAAERFGGRTQQRTSIGPLRAGLERFQPPAPIEPASSDTSPSGKEALIEWARTKFDSGALISVRAALKRFRGLPPKRLDPAEIVRLADTL